MIDKRLMLCGIAMKAGKITSGSNMVEESIRYGKAFLVIISEDASENTKKRISDKCSFYRVPYIINGTMDELGHMIGKEARSVISVDDEGFASQIIKKFKDDILLKTYNE